MQDAVRAYLELALGLTETSRKKAMKIAKQLVAESGAKAGQVQAVAEELISTSLANREAVTRLVRYELDRALGRVGLATTEEVGDLTSRLQELERKLRAAEARVSAAEATTAESASPATPAKKAVAKKAVAKKAATTTEASLASAPAGRPAKKAGAKKTVAKKTVAKKAVKRAAPAPGSTPSAGPATGAPTEREQP